MGHERKVDVALVSDDEIPACVEALSKAFGHDAPFFDIYFPGHDTPFGQVQASKRLTAWKQSSESSTFLKAVAGAEEGSQGHIIGLAVWTLMKEAPPAELSKVEDVEEVWPDKDDREFMTRLWREYVIPRTQSVESSGGRGVYGTWDPITYYITKHDMAQLTPQNSSRVARSSPRLSAAGRRQSSGRVGNQSRR